MPEQAESELTGSVVILNPATCGVYKNGGVRYKVDPTTGRRSDEVDDELNEQ